jgi:hypothetical protein
LHRSLAGIESGGFLTLKCPEGTHYARSLAMTVNESLQDRIIRTLVGLTVTVGAVIMAAAVPVLSPTGIVNLFFLVLGIEVLATGLIGWSPVYSLFGFSTTGRAGSGFSTTGRVGA